MRNQFLADVFVVQHLCCQAHSPQAGFASQFFYDFLTTLSQFKTAPAQTPLLL
jgi:hypothetical protein